LKGLLAVVVLEVTTKVIRTGTGMERDRDWMRARNSHSRIFEMKSRLEMGL